LQPPDSDYYHSQLNRPDIIIKNKKEKTYILIDMALPADKNVVQKEAEKKLKYMKCMIIPVIIGTTGRVTKGFKKNLEAIPGTHSVDALQ